MIVGLVPNSHRNATRRVANEVALIMESQGLRVIRDWKEGAGFLICWLYSVVTELFWVLRGGVVTWVFPY